MKWIAILVALPFAAACVGPLSELHESQYPNAAAARAADPSGWIPGILPNDATSIREVHKIDVSRTWGCFSTRRPDEVRALLVDLHARKAPGPIGSRPAEIFRHFSWWPDSMSERGLEAWEFRDKPGCPACTAAVVRVGMDVVTGTVCFCREPR